MAETANESYFDASIRHQVQVRRYASGLSTEILKQLEAADKDLSRLLRERLGELSDGARSDWSARRLKALLDDVRAARVAVMDAIRDKVAGQLTDQAQLEVEAEVDRLKEAIPIELKIATVRLEQVSAVVTSHPFQGKLLKTWFEELKAADQQRLTQAVNLGVIEGEGIDTIVQRVVGTKANAFADGIATVTRRQAEAVVRTAVNHVSNAAREEVWKANEDIIEGLRWTSTLDGRTSAVCRARDGQIFKPDEGPRPPAHINCRSVMVAVLSPDGVVGNRPSVVDTRTRDQREVDFRQQAKDQAGDDWKSMSAQERNKAVAAKRSAWAAENVGRVPAKTTYQEWLSRQKPAFQDDVLGPARGKLFRDGGLTLDQFVDRAGKELTLDDLKKAHPYAWARAMGKAQE